jgi:MraZ protein
MFLGNYEYKIDHKSRIPFPPRFREELRVGMVMTQGPDKCVEVYPLPEWEKVSAARSGLPRLSKTRRLNRFTFANAFPVDLDGQGRVAIPLSLRQYAEIGEALVVAGVNTFVEIWSRENWEKEQSLMASEAWHISESTEDRA